MIDKFAGKYEFLSNFYSVIVSYKDKLYPSVEHAYQAAKTFDLVQQTRIRLSNTPGKAKRLGKECSLRSDWEILKKDVMRRLLIEKFKHPNLLKKLLNTKSEELVEGNWWGDTFWGVCKGKGENNLGKLLMEVRENNG